VAVPLLTAAGIPQAAALAIANAGNAVFLLQQQVADLQVLNAELEARIFTTTSMQGG
jgi:NADP-dependent 3-hydroxy acid dehydrogenase YdfG